MIVFFDDNKQKVDNVHKKLMKSLLRQSLCGWPAPRDLGGQIKGNPWFEKQRNPKGQQIPRIRPELAGGVSEDRGPVTAPFPPHCPCFSWLSGWKWTIDLLDLWTGGRIWGLYWAPDSGIYSPTVHPTLKTSPGKTPNTSGSRWKFSNIILFILLLF